MLRLTVSRVAPPTADAAHHIVEFVGVSRIVTLGVESVLPIPDRNHYPPLAPLEPAPAVLTPIRQPMKEVN